MKKNKITLILFIGIIALTTISIVSTIAWYANGVSNLVDPVDVVIDCDRKLFISTKDELENEKTELKYEELNPVKNFAPVTSAHRDEWMSKKAQAPIFYDDTIYYPSEETPSLKEVNAGYFSQDIYLFSDDDVYVTLDPSATYIKPNEEYNKSYAKELYFDIQHSHYHGDDSMRDLSEEEIYERLNKLVEAMRFSFLILSDETKYDYVIVDPYKEEETLLGGVLDNDSDRYFDYYHNDDGIRFERLYGDINDRSLIVYDEELEEDTSYLDNEEAPSVFNAKHKSGVRTFNYEASVANGFSFKKEEAHSLEEFNNRVYSPLNIPVYKDKANKVNISIYIEGYDLGSVNYTMGATFLAGLEFVISREM